MEKKLVYGLLGLVCLCLAGAYALLAGSKNRNAAASKRPPVQIVAPANPAAEEAEPEPFRRIKAEFVKNRAFFFNELVPALHKAATGDAATEKLVADFVRDYEPAQLMRENQTHSQPDRNRKTPVKNEFVFVAEPEIKFAGVRGESDGPFLFSGERMTLLLDDNPPDAGFIAIRMLAHMAYVRGIKSGKAGERDDDAEFRAVLEAKHVATHAVNNLTNGEAFRTADAVLADKTRTRPMKTGGPYRFPNVAGCEVLKTVLPGKALTPEQLGLLQMVFMVRQGKTKDQALAALRFVETAQDEHFCCAHEYGREQKK